MLLIAGLGNPGNAYERTRHNAGFMLADRLSEAFSIRLRSRGNAQWGRGLIGGEEALLIKPQAFMNLSGEAVSSFADAEAIPVESIIVAFDDCDLPLGRLRLRKGGGSGGHKGVESIIRCLGSGEFVRIRLGIGRPPYGDAADYVLSPFAEDELDTLEDMLSRGVAAIEALVEKGLEYAMNNFNAFN